MRKIIVTADIEVHTKTDVSTFEVRDMFGEVATMCEILTWVEHEADRVVNFVVDSLGIKEIKDNTYVSVYAIKKNIVLKPVEEYYA